MIKLTPTCVVRPDQVDCIIDNIATPGATLYSVVLILRSGVNFTLNTDLTANQAQEHINAYYNTLCQATTPPTAK